MTAARATRVFTVLSVVTGVLLALTTWIARDIPPDYDCGDERPAGQEQRLEDFRRGQVPAHALVAFCALGGVAAAARARRGGPFRPGVPTFVALGAVALSAALAAAGVWGPALVLAIGPALVLALLGAFGAAGGAILGSLILAGLGAALLALLRRGRSFAWAEAFFWVVLLFLGGHGVLLTFVGEGPIFC